MLNVEKHQQWERGIVMLMNLDGWQLEWCEGKNEHYDAKGKTPKGFDCILKFKLLQAYFTTKTIKKEIYDALMEEKCMKFYFVFDSRGNYLYHLDSIPKKHSEYSFSENDSSLITRYSEQN